MSSKFLLRFILGAVLVVVLYMIWPLPFWLMSERVFLPTANKVSQVVKIGVSPFSLLVKIKDLDQVNKNLENENNSLKAQVATLENENVIAKKVSAELNSSGAGREVLVSRIIGRTPQTFSENLIIDRGTDDSLKVGQAVLSNGYLIGTISRVDGATSEVHLITNHDSLIPAILSTSRESGLVQGGLEGLSLTEIPVDSTVAVGDKVITSGLGNDLPAGILIGDVYQVVKGDKGLFQSAKVNSPIEVSQLEVVSVVK